MPQEFPAIRLVALDLDGTLLNREGHVTPRTRSASCCG
jgi:hydroxymethylpyrimidine pyrophosphatase-like HAD family hydrolase